VHPGRVLVERQSLTLHVDREQRHHRLAEIAPGACLAAGIRTGRDHDVDLVVLEQPIEGLADSVDTPAAVRLRMLRETDVEFPAGQRDGFVLDQRHQVEGALRRQSRTLRRRPVEDHADVGGPQIFLGARRHRRAQRNRKDPTDSNRARSTAGHRFLQALHPFDAHDRLLAPLRRPP